MCVCVYIIEMMLLITIIKYKIGYICESVQKNNIFNAHKLSVHYLWNFKQKMIQKGKENFYTSVPSYLVTHTKEKGVVYTHLH